MNKKPYKMKVIAKFKCDEVAQTVYGGKVRMSPVTGDNPENKEFFKWTPSGSLEMGTVNLEALKEFIPGSEYFITFEKAE